jgi:hypothetical protein
MAGFLTTITEIRNEQDERVDLPNSKGVHQPIVLKLTGGLSGESRDMGDGRTEFTMTGGAGGVAAFDGYHGSGATGRTDVVGLTSTEYVALPFSFTASPSNEKVFIGIPLSLGSVTITIDGVGVDMLARQLITVASVDYQLIETTNNLTGTSLPFVVSVRSAADGEPGPTGPTGPGYFATSNTTLTFGNG